MKTLLFVLLFSIFTIKLFANPIDMRTFEISELFFDENNDYTIELVFPFYLPDDIMDIDSICLYSSTQSITMVFNTNIESTNGIAIITKDSLPSEFLLNKNGDQLIVEVFYTIDDEVSSLQKVLLFGNYEGSVVSNISATQSIVSMGVSYGESENYVYSKDNTPTLGNHNDTAGVCGYLTGKVYKLNGDVAANTSFFLDFPFTADAQGNYKASICSREYKNSTIHYGSDIWLCKFSSFTPFNNNIEPEESYEFDIQLLDTLTSINEKPSKLNSTVMVYPNPATESLTIRSKEFKKYKNINILLLDVKGQEVANYLKTSEKEITIKLGKNITAGIYILNISGKNQLIYSQKIVVNPF